MASGPALTRVLLAGGCAAQEVVVAVCGESQTVASFDFDASLADPERNHVIETVGGATRAEDQGALEFDGASYAVLADDAAWRTPEGRLTFRFRAASCGEGTGHSASGLVSRDADFREEGGHLTLAWTAACSLLVRSQRQVLEPGEPLGDVFLEAEDLAVGAWHEVRVRAAPPTLTLWVDGEQRGEAAIEVGWDGNANPWVLGANAHESENGGAEPVTSFAGPGVWIDDFRIEATLPCSTER